MSVSRRAPFGPAPLAVLGLSFLLSGCVVVIGEEERDRDRDDVWVSDRDTNTSVYRTRRTSAQTADQELRERISESLEGEPLLEGQRVVVVTDGSEVTLHGEVRDLEVFDRVIEIVRASEGVEEIVSRLVVRIR
jgi:osmotically-inducible protein OsmY